VAAQYATGGPLLRSGDIAYGDIGRQLPAATPLGGVIIKPPQLC
jgi:hypothetical protein